MYIRIKRKQQTFFVTVKPGDTIEKVKQILVVMSKLDHSIDEVRLMKDNVVLEGTVLSTGLTNDCMVQLVFKLEPSGWEPVDITTSPPLN